MRSTVILLFLSVAAIAASANCDPQVLGPSEADQVEEQYQQKVVRPTDLHKELVRRAFAMAPPFLCQAVERVVFVADAGASGATMGWTYQSVGDLIYISALMTTASVENLNPVLLARRYPSLSDAQVQETATKNQAEVIQSILHEAAHSAHYLIDSQRDRSLFSVRPDADAWDASAITAARAKVAELRLGAGLLEGEWTRLHSAFVAHGMGRAYGGGRSDLLAGGFMSAYGATKPSDDVAEMTSWAIAAPLYDGLSTPAKDDACKALRSAGSDDISAANAAVIVKLFLLEDLGFISEADRERCVGPVQPTGATSEGFHVYSGSRLAHTASRSMTAGIGRDTEFFKWVFTLDADGQVVYGGDPTDAHYALKLLLAEGAWTTPISDVDDVSWPRGIYTLVRPNEPNSFWINAEDKGATLWATRGFVLVFRASNRLIQGSIVPQMFLRPFTAVPVPEVPPSRITFVLRR